MFKSIVHFECPISIIFFEILKMPIFLPLSPNEVAPKMLFLVGTVIKVRGEILLGSSSPPYSAFDYLSDKVEIITFADIIVKVALSNDGLNVPILFVEN
jgi:hypothetical protein